MLLIAIASASLAMPAEPTPLAATPTPLASLPDAILSPSVEALFAAPATPLFFRDSDDKEPDLLSYTYVEVGGIDYNVDDLGGSDESVDTYYGRASLSLGFLYLFAGYENQSADFMDTDSDVIRLGLGGRANIGQNLDVLGEVAWLYNDVSSDLASLDDSNNGYELRSGLRWLPIQWGRGGLELDGNLVFVSLDNRLGSDDEDLGVELGARVHFLKLFSVGGMYTMFEDDDLLGLNLRLAF